MTVQVDRMRDVAGVGEVQFYQLAFVNGDHWDVGEGLVIDGKQHGKAAIEKADVVIQVHIILDIKVGVGADFIGVGATIFGKIEYSRVGGVFDGRGRSRRTIAKSQEGILIFRSVAGNVVN